MLTVTRGTCLRLRKHELLVVQELYQPTLTELPSPCSISREVPPPSPSPILGDDTAAGLRHCFLMSHFTCSKPAAPSGWSSVLPQSQRCVWNDECPSPPLTTATTCSVLMPVPHRRNGSQLSIRRLVLLHPCV